MKLELSLKRKQTRLLFFTGLFALTSTAFNNCGQPGDLAVVPGEKITTSSTPPGTNDPGNPGNPGSSPKYISKSKIVNVNVADNNKVDLLVVIDNSGSMKTEQANMAARFSTLIDQLSGLDWQVGVVTTDVVSDANLKDGRLIAVDKAGSQFLMTSKMDLMRAKEDFASVIQRPEEGSGNEQGIKATYRTLQRALSGDGAKVNQPNRDLIRPDAALAVLVVTDANETPDIANDPRNTSDGLMKYVSDSYGGKKNFVFNSIIVKSGDKTCLGNSVKGGNESYGVDYEKLSNLTGGIIGTVCASDYGSQLKLIGEKVVMQVRSIQLDCAPVDKDKDGKLDVAVYEVISGGSGVISPAVLGPELHGYQIDGRSLVFSSNLPEGSFEAKYVCLDTTK